MYIEPEFYERTPTIDRQSRTFSQNWVNGFFEVDISLSYLYRIISAESGVLAYIVKPLWTGNLAEI